MSPPGARTNGALRGQLDARGRVLRIGRGSRILASSVALALAFAVPATAATLNVGPAGTPYTASQVRGMWFTAPTNFTITSLNVPGSGNQNIQVVRFNSGPPPSVISGTTAHTTLYSTVNNTSTGAISVSIPISSGDIIGILGARGTNGGSMTNPDVGAQQSGPGG